MPPIEPAASDRLRTSSLKRLTLTSVAAIACAMVLGITSAASAASVTYQSTDPALLIPDNAFNGTPSPGSVASSTISIDPFAHNLIEHLSVTVAINHDYVGDLNVMLEGPDGTLVTLVERPGGVPIYGLGVGDSSSLDANSPITFDDHASSGALAYTMGAGLGQNDVIGDLANHPDTHDNFIPSSMTHIGGLDGFIGMPLIGEWTLHVGDSAPGAVGTLEGWSLSATAVPNPGAAAAGVLLMTGLIGAGLIRQPRRRAGQTDAR